MKITTKVFVSVFFLFLTVIVSEASAGGVQQVSTQEAATMIKQNSANADFIILDVRPGEAYKQGHIQGALSMPVRSASFSADVDKLDTSKTYLVYCVRGGMTAQAVAIMQSKGFNSIIAAVEGIVGWSEAGYPLVSD